MRDYNSKYTGDQLKHIAFPLGGIGAGMFCMQGSGMLGNFSLRNTPEVFCEPNVFSSICVKGDKENVVRVIEGQVPYHKIFGNSGEGLTGAGNGLHGKNYGLPRFKDNDFESRFPFVSLNFYDDQVPLDVSVCGWSPFTPLDADASSNPVAALEYTFKNTSDQKVEAIYYFHAFNFMNAKPVHGSVRQVKYDLSVFKREDGFVLYQPPVEDGSYLEGAFYAAIDDEDLAVNTDWFDGGWFDILTMQWNDIKAGRLVDKHHSQDKSPGGSLALPFSLEPGEVKTIKLKLAWYVPKSNLRMGGDTCCDNTGTVFCDKNKKQDKETHKPWYSGQYGNVDEVMNYFAAEYKDLYDRSRLFTGSFYESTLPDEILEAVSANLSIIKSPTVLRQTDGRLWCWEGCCDSQGCCTGSCTHVWNYAQALCHLFPELERTFRQTEYNECQNDQGHQEFRALLPIRKSSMIQYDAASDGQLGGIMKMYREWRILGDNSWLEGYWDKVSNSLDYCINRWDKKLQGVLTEPHHNTYDIAFWGADGMCSSFYIGALKAASLMGQALGKDVKKYEELYTKGRKYIEEELYNGEYFYQKVDFTTLEAKLDLETDNDNLRHLLEKEGPKYQYGKGCLSDGVLGAWMAKVCGLGDILDEEKIKSHLLSIHRYNFKQSLLEHENPQRPGYAVGDEGGLVLCTWPKGEKPSLPFVYSDEVWTGIEYQVASHLIYMGNMEEGLEIVKACRDRYDGTKRNPFSEYECGHWYARAMASYALLEGMSGVRYDAIDKTLYVSSKNMDSFSVFLCTNSGYGVVNLDNGQVSVDVRHGEIGIDNIILST